MEEVKQSGPAKNDYAEGEYQASPLKQPDHKDQHRQPGSDRRSQKCGIAARQLSCGPDSNGCGDGANDQTCTRREVLLNFCSSMKGLCSGRPGSHTETGRPAC